jgi:uncharacterized protein (DUF169 family)
MDYMANMKRLQEDIDEAVMGLLDSDARGVYKDWIEKHAEPHIKEWLEKHDYNVETCRSFEFVKYITDIFIDWISNG